MSEIHKKFAYERMIKKINGGKIIIETESDVFKNHKV